MGRGFPRTPPWGGASETPSYAQDSPEGLHFPPSFGVLPEELEEVAGKRMVWASLMNFSDPVTQTSGGTQKEK